MRLLLLGGTSFFGKDICHTFSRAGWDITLFTRGNATPDDLPAHAHIRGDRNRMEDLRIAAEAGPWDLVIDNIAFEARHVRDALRAFRTAKRYLLMSTVSVYRFAGPRYPQPLLEDYVDYDLRPENEDPSDVHWVYARGKLEAERVCVDESEIPWTILRPPVVYGPFDVTGRGFWYLARLLDGGPILLAEGGSQTFRLVYSKDVATCCLLAAQTDHAVGRAYNLAQGEVITLRQFVEESARALKVKPRLVSAPLDVVGERGGPYANMINLVPDLTQVREELGFRPTPFESFAASTAAWYVENSKGLQMDLLEGRAAEVELANELKSFYKTLA